MNHEEVLAAALAGGPMPLAVKEHLDACADCRSELEALRSLEERLSGSAPEWTPPAGMERRFVETARTRRRRPPRVRWEAAAAAALVLAFCMALLALRHTPAPAPISPAGNHDAYETALLYDPWPETAGGLMESADEMATEIPEAPPTEVEDYLGYVDWGEWNG